jgi:hypothetical protein
MKPDPDELAAAGATPTEGAEPAAEGAEAPAGDAKAAAPAPGAKGAAQAPAAAAKADPKKK